MQQKIFICLALVIVSVSGLFIAPDTHTRARRSPEEGFFAKAKNTVSQFGREVKNTAVKGYEEVKNLFSKDRKVGDYVLDKIDARFADYDDDEETTTVTLDEVLETTSEVARAKRDTADIEQEVRDAASGEIKPATEGSPTKSSTLPNNAEVSPGYPPAMVIIVPPLTCQKGFFPVRGKCRRLIDDVL